MVLRCVCIITVRGSSVGYTRIKRLITLRRFRKFSAGCLLLLKRQTDKKAFGFRVSKTKKKQTQVISQEISSDERKNSLSRIITKHNERF